MQEAQHIRYDTGRMFMGSTPSLIAGAVILILLVSLLAAFFIGSAEPAGITILLGVSAVVAVAFRCNHSRMEIDANEMRLNWAPFYHARIRIDAGQAYIVSTGTEKRLKEVMTAVSDAGIPVHSEGYCMQPDSLQGPKKPARFRQKLLTKLRRLPSWNN